MSNEDNNLAFAPIEDTTENKPAEAEKSEEKQKENNIESKNSYIEQDCVFANGLPAWNIEPPTLVVRKRKKQ